MCSLIAHVEDGKVVRIQGDPDHPYTAGVACGKVNRDADLVISWGADLAATNLHFYSLVEHAKKSRGLPLVVIDPRKTRSARNADLYLPIRIGTDAALALGVMHILVRDKLVDRDYIASQT